MEQKTESITFLGLPMPPSVNAIYANNKFAGRGRIKTEAYRYYLRDVEYWRLKHLSVVNAARASLQNMPSGHALRLSYKFWFARNSVLTLKGRPKRNDTANRLKPLDDALAPLLGIDDCLFWDGEFEKITYSPDPLTRDFVDVTIRVINVV